MLVISFGGAATVGRAPYGIAPYGIAALILAAAALDQARPAHEPPEPIAAGKP